MYLTHHDIANLPDFAFKSVYAMRLAVQMYFACGITEETAARIIADFSR